MCCPLRFGSSNCMVVLAWYCGMLKFNHSPENAQLELQSSSMHFVATILVLQKQEAVLEQENEV